jgi:serine/threonine-protein phosphatase CPPED1
MNRLLLLAATIGTILTAVAFSRQTTATSSPNTTATPIQIATAERNPWTHLKPLNHNDDQFQFAIVSDRTGGRRANIFAKAVQQLNLLQPSFVMSVGDLIEGYTTKEEDMVKQWDEFDSYTKKLEMPFFYTPGNHDLTNTKMIEYWGGRYGKSYFHFVYKNVLFLSLNSEDGKATKISPEQVESLKKALEENKGVRWTLVFVHKPMWADKDPESNGWLAFEKALEGRKYTVFCGHVHRYQKYVRNGMNYYQLATTGGGSRLRGVEYGEFDHLTWITMKNDGPLIANILMDGILPENLQLPETAEPGVVVKKQPLHSIKGIVTLDSKPLSGYTVTFSQMEAPMGFRAATADGLTGADGSYTLSTYTKFDGVPAGKFRVTVAKTGRGYYDGELPVKSVIPEKYTKASTSPLIVELKVGANTIDLSLQTN